MVDSLHRHRFLCLTMAWIPGVLALTDCIMGLASGMTIRFMPIFFKQEVGPHFLQQLQQPGRQVATAPASVLLKGGHGGAHWRAHTTSTQRTSSGPFPWHLARACTDAALLPARTQRYCLLCCPPPRPPARPLCVQVALSPLYVNLMYCAIPLCLSSAAFVAQRQSRLIGRVQTMVMNRGIGISLLYWIATNQQHWQEPRIMVPIYIARTSIMNSIYPLQASRAGLREGGAGCGAV